MKLCMRQMEAALAIVLLLCTAGCSHEQEVKIIKIGVSAYQSNDTFIASIMSELEQVVKAREAAGEIAIRLDISDGKGSQNVQNEQVERYIALDYDVICVNVVDRTSVSGLIDSADEAGIPIIFFNREPVEEDIFRKDNVYYIGSNPKESGVLQGEMLARAYYANHEEIDRNQNGVVEYAILEGEVGHQDTVIRTESSIKTLEEAGVPVEKMTGWRANFDRNQAAALVEQWFANDGEMPDIIISNNDDMALGAIDAFEKMGKSMIPMVGIDGTPQGKKAVDEGKLLGTAVSDAGLYAKTIYETALYLGKDGSLPPEILVNRGRYIWIPWEIYKK